MTRKRPDDLDERVYRACWEQLTGLTHQEFFDRVVTVSQAADKLKIDGKTAAPRGKPDLIDRLIANISMVDFLSRVEPQPGDLLDRLLSEAKAGTATWEHDVPRAARKFFADALRQRSDLMRLRMLLWSQHHDPVIAENLAGRQFNQHMRDYARRFDELLAAFGRRRANGVGPLGLLNELGALEDGFMIRAALEPHATKWSNAFAVAVFRVLEHTTEPVGPPYDACEGPGPLTGDSVRAGQGADVG